MYSEEESGKLFFTATLEFPSEKKKRITAYLRKHKADIIQDIIEKAG